jgi:hypothetical protein
MEERRRFVCSNREITDAGRRQKHVEMLFRLLLFSLWSWEQDHQPREQKGGRSGGWTREERKIAIREDGRVQETEEMWEHWWSTQMALGGHEFK